MLAVGNSIAYGPATINVSRRETQKTTTDKGSQDIQYSIGLRRSVSVKAVL